METGSIKNHVSKVCESKTFKKMLYAIGIFVIASFIFQLGVWVGFHKASFGQAWGENYNRNFGTMMHRGGMMGDLDDTFPNAHGAAGKIIKTELPTIIVEDKDTTEKVILIKDDTIIRKGNDTVTAADLKTDDFVVVIGTPNSTGQIEAKLIRVFEGGLPVSMNGMPLPI